MPKIILTGIKPTGMPHLGNYTGAICPALKSANTAGITSLLFIANYHSLTTIHNATLLKKMVYEVSATWLACGLDPKQTIIYCQSDIPEVFELSWILSCLTPKGLMNRAHSYKAFLQTQSPVATHQSTTNNQTTTDQKITDQKINMGIYNYPILMAADILLFSADEVPVSEDQKQHLEIARDLALKFNHVFRTSLLKPPQTGVTGQLLPGLDGRKMSKSYNNHIPLFCSSKELHTLIKKIKTDSSDPKSPKDPNTSLLFAIHKAFVSPSQSQKLARQYQQGIGWGDVKEIVYKQLDSHLSDKRKKYQELINQPKVIEDILQQGAKKARSIAKPFMQKIRSTIGIS